MPLTDKQARFAENLAAGMTATDAARAAGYLTSSPQSLRVTASRLTSLPSIQQAVFQHRERRLQGPLASMALACLEGVMQDLAAPPAARIQAAKFILEAAGHGLENRRLSARHPDDIEKGISNFTLAELEAMVAAAEERMNLAQGKVIESGDNDPPQLA
jgi:hypothetical protein